MKKKVYLKPETETVRMSLEKAFLGASNERYDLGYTFDEEFEDDEE